MALLLVGVPQTAWCQDHLYMLETTIPVEADRWYMEHYADSTRPAFAQVFAQVYSAPDTAAPKLGDLIVSANWEPYLHFSWIYVSDGAQTEVVWREDVGDWGYGIDQFVIDVKPAWVRLPPGPFGDVGWVRVVDYGKPNGFVGSAYSVVDNLLYLEGIEARRDGTDSTEFVTGEVLIEEIDQGSVRFRLEVPSDMPCTEEVAADPPLVHYRAPISHFLTDDLDARFRLAYPKGC